MEGMKLKGIKTERSAKEEEERKKRMKAIILGTKVKRHTSITPLVGVCVKRLWCVGMCVGVFLGGLDVCMCLVCGGVCGCVSGSLGCV